MRRFRICLDLKKFFFSFLVIIRTSVSFFGLLPLFGLSPLCETRTHLNNWVDCLASVRVPGTCWVNTASSKALFTTQPQTVQQLRPADMLSTGSVSAALCIFLRLCQSLLWVRSGLGWGCSTWLGDGTSCFKHYSVCSFLLWKHTWSRCSTSSREDWGCSALIQTYYYLSNQSQ